MIWFVNVSLTKHEQMCGIALLGHYVTILSALLDIQNVWDSFTLTTRMVKSDM
jgi:hypothetical protein